MKISKEQEDIIRIETVLDEYKETTNAKLDKIFKKLSQTQFTPNQVLSFFGALIVTMAGVMIYIEGIKSNTRNNSTRIDNVQEQYKSIDKKLDRLLSE